MTLNELRQHLDMVPRKYDDAEIKVWLPGSTISLSPMQLAPRNGSLWLEGNVDQGSALADRGHS